MSLLKNSFVIAALLAAPALAFQVEQRLPDDVQENKAQEIFKDIRCVVCEGESLAESSADMAYDMRAYIRKEVAAGKSSDQIKAQFVANYGEQVLQTPPMGIKTYFLWFMPFFMLIIGALCLIAGKRKKKV